ncbi:hypothetical protein [Neisseria sp.]|uniref:hypothetical protein n=1 Tax=Neisseria sp. TaxID=192066 RepID=UPI0035A07784
MTQKAKFILLAAIITATAVLVFTVSPTARTLASLAVCAPTGGKWHHTKEYCIRPDCRQNGTCGLSAGQDCPHPGLNVGDHLDKAWFVWGEGVKRPDGRYEWWHKAGNWPSAIVTVDKEETVTAIRCHPQE